jgi:hypothetical protein
MSSLCLPPGTNSPLSCLISVSTPDGLSPPRKFPSPLTLRTWLAAPAQPMGTGSQNSAQWTTAASLSWPLRAQTPCSLAGSLFLPQAHLLQQQVVSSDTVPCPEQVQHILSSSSRLSGLHQTLRTQQRTVQQQQQQTIRIWWISTAMSQFSSGKFRVSMSYERFLLLNNPRQFYWWRACSNSSRTWSVAA